MNILFLAPLPEPTTGQSLACQVLFDALQRDHRVDVVNLNKREFKQGISSFGRILEVGSMLVKVWRKRSNAEVIYLTISESVAGNLKDLMIYAICCRRLCRIVIHLHGGAGMREIMLGKNSWRRKLNEFFLRRLGAIIVLGERHVATFSGAVNRNRIHIVQNFAQDYLFAETEATERKFDRLRPLRILFLSNLLPGKGHEELLDAYLSLDAQLRELVELDFAGGFESDAQARAFLQRIAGSARVRYHGVVHGEEKRKLFAAAHIFCLPTYYPYEGQPISILEAYASGCVVITTDHSGVFDIFDDGVNGFGVAKQSSRAIKERIEALLADPGVLRQIALDNLALARRRFRMAAHTRQLQDVMEQVASESRANVGAYE